jgi:hypothetical protein
LQQGPWGHLEGLGIERKTQKKMGSTMGGRRGAPRTALTTTMKMGKGRAAWP